MRVTVLTVLAAAANAYYINHPEGNPAGTTPCETSTVAPPPAASTPCETSTVAPPPPPASTPCESSTAASPPPPSNSEYQTPAPVVTSTPCESETPAVPPVSTPWETEVPVTTTPCDTPAVPTTMIVAPTSAGGNWTEPPATTGPAMIPTGAADKHAVPVLGSLAAVALVNIFFL